MRAKITTDLQKRYGEERQAFLLLNKASYLDPRFHRLVHLNEEKKKEVRTAIEREMSLHVAAETVPRYHAH